MAKTTARVGKSETLTIRLDPKTRFVLEYLSRLNGQTITTVVERAIVQTANVQSIPATDEFGSDSGWQDFWDVSEGARALKLARRSEFFPTFEEERRLAFCEEHWPFFFVNSHKTVFRYPWLNILWPRIDDFIEIHEQSKSGGKYWAAGEAMQETLRGAGLKPPAWPIEDEKPKSGRYGGGKPTDLDDEIPF